jgi:hypothetical protein
MPSYLTSVRADVTPGERGMSYGGFTDRQQPPTMQEMEASLGRHLRLWERLLGFAQDAYSAPYSLRFYGRNYGWALLFRKGGKALLALFPGNHRLTALVVLGEEECAAAEHAALSSAVIAIVREATPFKEGRWLFVPVDTARDAADVEALVKLKRSPAPKQR